jgi:hypothetical protein
MFKKKTIVVALTTALVMLGTGATLAAVQSGVRPSTSTSAPGSLEEKKAIKAGSDACKEAKSKVERDSKEDADKKAEDDDKDSKKKVLKRHHSHEDTDKDDDRKAKHAKHVAEKQSVCGDNDVDDGKHEDKKDDDKKSKESSTKNSESRD